MDLIVVEDSLAGFRGDTCLVMNKDNGDYFVISTITRAEFAHAYGDIETLAFRSDSDGTVYDWEDVAGGGNMTRDQVLAVLATGELNDWASEDDSYFEHEEIDYLGYVREMYAVDEWEDLVRDDPTLDV